MRQADAKGNPRCDAAPGNGHRRTGPDRSIRSDVGQWPQREKPAISSAPPTHDQSGTRSRDPLVATAPSRSIATFASPAVNRNKEKRAKPSYASLPRALLATRRMLGMTGLGIRVLLTAHALWRGLPPLLLPTTEVPCVLGLERTRFARGRREVIAAGFLVETRAYVRPGGAGSTAQRVQRAAEYDLPHAHKGAVVQLEHGDKRVLGYWRLLSADLLQIVGLVRDRDNNLHPFLTDDQLRVLIALAQGPRTEGGALEAPEQHHTTAQTIVGLLPRLTVRTAQRALAALEARGLARKVSGGAGRAAAVYQPDGLLTGGLSWKRKSKA